MAIAVSGTTCRIADLINVKSALLKVVPAKPDSLKVSAAFGSTAPQTRTIDVTNIGGGELAWRAYLKHNSPWVTLDPDTGTAGRTPTLQAVFNPSGLDSVVYQDTVVVEDRGGSGSLETPLWYKIRSCDDTLIAVGSTVSTSLTTADCGALHRPRGWFAKLYRFTGAANDSVSIELPAAFDAFVALDTSLAANRSPLTQQDDCLGSPGDPCLYYVRLPATAPYWVEVTSADSADTGTFMLRLLHPRLPNAPSSLEQRLTDSVTIVGTGDTVSVLSLLLRAVVSDSDLGDQLHLEAEVRPVGVAFTGPNVPNGPSVANGQPAWVSTGTLSDKTAYHWRVRAGDNTGRSGPWSSLPGTTQFVINVPHPPSAPTGLAQSKPDGTPINVGGTSDTDVVVFSGSVSDQDPGDQLRLQVEVKPIGTPFSNLPTDSSLQVSGGVAEVKLHLGNNIDYHWQARTTDQTGLASSPWTSFGNNAESSVDLRVQLANVPNAPTALAQYQSDGTTSLAVGGVTASNFVVLKGVVSDPDAGQTAELDVEVRPIGTNFTNQAMYFGTQVANGTTSSVTVGPLANNTSYHWQAQAKDNTGRTGAWVSFPISSPNAETVADFSVQQPPTQLQFTVNPNQTVAGSVITPAIQVTAKDINGQVSTGFTDTVSMTIEFNAGGGTLAGTVKVKAVAGVATFSDLSINKTGTNYTLRATTFTPSLFVVSQPFTITPGPTTQLVFTTNPPASVQSGAPMTPAVQVTAMDANLNKTPLFTGNVSLAITPNTGTAGAVLTGGNATAAVAGVAAFSGLSVDKVGTGYTLDATSGTLKRDTSTAFSITPGPATHLAYTVQPTKTPSSSPITPAVTVRAFDVNNNQATAFVGGVTLSITTGTGTSGAVISNPGPVNAVNGDASFPNASINLVGPGYRLDANAAGLTKATSDTFSIINSAISNTLSTVVPSPTTITASGGSITSTITVTALDGSGQPVQGASVTLSASPSAGVTVNQPSTLTNASGVTTGTISSDSAGPKVITAVVGPVTLAQTPTVTVNPAAPSVLVFTIQPNTTTAGAAINSGSGGVVVTARDQFGNTATSFTSLVTMAIAAGPGTFAPTSTNTATAVSGVAVFDNLRIYKAGSGYQLRASGGALPIVLSTTFAINTAPLIKLGFTAQPGTTVDSAPLTPNPQVAGQDSVANTVTSFIGQVRMFLQSSGINPGGGTLSGTTQVNAVNGVAPFSNLRVNALGTGYSLLATSSGLVPDTSVSFNIIAGSAAKLGITTAPSSSAQSGVAFAQQPVIQIQDAQGNPVSQGGTLVTATIQSGTGGTLVNATATTNASGAATFSGLAINGLVGNYTLSFSATGLASVTSGTIVLSSGPAAKLAITTAPSSTAQSGVAFAQQPVIQIQDASGNPVSQSGTLVTATIASGPGGVLANATANTNASGAAIFSGLSITGTAGSYTLRFNATSLTSVTSGSITLSAGQATRLAIATPPSSTAQSGVPLTQQPVIQLQDASGNPVSQSGVLVTATIASGPGSATLSNATATTSASGAATFSGLAITGPAVSYTLSFGATGLTPVVSGTITLNAGQATKLGITTQPSSTAQSGVAFAQQPVIQLQDASGNSVSQSGVVITATVASGPGGFSLSNATATTGSNGAAAFSGLALTGSIGTYTLTFSSGSLTPVTSGSIALSAGAAAKLAITTAPSSSAQSGVAFAQQPVIQLRDAAGNSVSQSGTLVTAIIASGPGGASLSNATATTVATGAATFSGLAINGLVGSYTLTFTATGLTQVTSGTITLSVGPATKLTISTQPSSTAQSGVAFAQQPVLQLRDAGNNPVSQSGTVITATIASGPAGTPSGNTATTDASGTATFTSLAITGPAGSYTLAFGDGSLTPATSNSITLSAGTATKLGFTTPPPSTAQSGVALSPQPVIQIQDASGNPVSQSGTVITATIASGPAGTLSNNTATTNANGTATFTGLAINGLVGTYTLDFNGGGLTKATSNAINLSTGPATNLVITAQPTNAVAGVAIAPAIQVVLKDAGGNTVTSPRTDITMAIGTNPGGGTLSGTLTVRTGASTGTSSFSDLSINKAAQGYTLVASANGLISATSSTFNITPAAAATLVFTIQPTATAAGASINQGSSVQVTARDQFGNTATSFGGDVSLAITANTGTAGAVLGGTTSVAAVAGVATFTTLSIDLAGLGYKLDATAAGLSGATSTAFDITP